MFGLEELPDVPLKIILQYIHKKDADNLRWVSSSMYQNVRRVIARYRGLLVIEISKDEHLSSCTPLLQFSDMNLFAIMKVDNIFWNVLPYKSFLRRFKSRIKGLKIDNKLFEHVSKEVSKLTKLHLNSEITAVFDLLTEQKVISIKDFDEILNQKHEFEDPTATAKLIKSLMVANQDSLEEVSLFESNILGMHKLDKSQTRVERVKISGDCGLATDVDCLIKQKHWYSSYSYVLRTGFQNLLAGLSECLVELKLHCVALDVCCSVTHMNFSLHKIKTLSLIECGGNGRDILPLLNICASSLESLEIERMNIEGLQLVNTMMSKLKKFRIMDACNGSDGRNFAPFVNLCGSTLEQLNIVRTKIEQFNITSPLTELRSLHIELDKDEPFHIIKDLICASRSTLQNIWCKGISINDFYINDQKLELLSHICLNQPTLTVSDGVKRLLLAACANLKTLDCNVATFPDMQFESGTFGKLGKIKLYISDNHSRDTVAPVIQNLMMASSSSLHTLDIKNVNLVGFKMAADSRMLKLAKIKLQSVDSELQDIRNLISVCHNVQLLYLTHKMFRPEFQVLKKEHPDVGVALRPGPYGR